ncbi:hypothetical protein AB0B10_25985 [Micromonospora arborensis]|uniref:hypothetical protein n=1 Tax=Micromonospora arborensis TaxID=2116518 RepID=UPI0034033B51
MRILPAVMRRTARPTALEAAREAYFNADRHAQRVRAELTRPMSGIARAGLIGQRASLEEQMARHYPAAFSPDTIPCEDDRDMAESRQLAAVLLHLVADAEYAASVGGPRLLTSSELEPYAGPVLDRMASTRDPEERGQLLTDLYDAVVDVVGGQAAEAIACLPAPGHEQLVTLGQRLNALLGSRLRQAAREVAWCLIVLVVAEITAAVVGRAHTSAQLGATITLAGAVAAGMVSWATPLLRTHRMPAVTALLAAAAFGLIVGDARHDIGSNALVAAISLTLAVGGVLIWRLRRP